MKKYFVYILSCSDDSYYTGITNDIDLREEQHNQGLDKKAYTFKRRPVKLVWYQEFENPNEAIAKERQIKGWNRKKKEALIDNNLELLPLLSQNGLRQAQTDNITESNKATSLRQAQTDNNTESNKVARLRQAQTDSNTKNNKAARLRQTQTDNNTESNKAARLRQAQTNNTESNKAARLRQAQTDNNKKNREFSSLQQHFNKLSISTETENFQSIIAKLPYTKPFLFVDAITEINDNGVVGNYTFKEDSDFYKGHFKDYPVTPGVLLTECCAQIGLVCLGIYLLKGALENNPKIGLSSSEMEFLKPVFPNETVTVSSELIYFRFHKLKCKVKMHDANGNLVCKGIIAGMFKADKDEA